MADPILIVDDDADVRDSLRALLESAGFEVRDFASAKGVLADTTLAEGACLIADIRMPDMDGLSLQEELVNRRVGLPVIIVTGHGDVPLAVRAMKAGAVDFIEKPFDDELLLQSIKRALSLGRGTRDQVSLAQTAASRIALLTERERQVLEHVVAGRLNKQIAAELGTVEKTIKVHRGRMMAKLEVRSVADLVRLAERINAGSNP